MSALGMTVSGLGMLQGFLVISALLVLGRSAMGFGGILVMLGSFVVSVLRHS